MVLDRGGRHRGAAVGDSFAFDRATRHRSRLAGRRELSDACLPISQMPFTISTAPTNSNITPSSMFSSFARGRSMH